MKGHLKKLNAPKTWNLARKDDKWVTKPRPGPHTIEYSITVNNLIRDFLKIADSAREVKYILTYKEVLVDGKKKTDFKQQVGFMDVFSIPSIKKYFRCTIDKKGRLEFIPIEEKEASLKIVSIKKIGMSKGGKKQFTLSDGRNMFNDNKDYKISDSLLITVPKQEVKEHIKMSIGATILLMRGKHAGIIAKLERIEGKKIYFKINNEVHETNKDYALVVGKDAPLIKVVK